LVNARHYDTARPHRSLGRLAPAKPTASPEPVNLADAAALPRLLQIPH
jgi:hypothetical protein